MMLHLCVMDVYPLLKAKFRAESGGVDISVEKTFNIVKKPSNIFVLLHLISFHYLAERRLPKSGVRFFWTCRALRGKICIQPKFLCLK